ncbi:hypothetical protein G4B88_008220 [Cannabis sativa]|uniref:Lactoylglutathione lyase n=1 Tax=Cannabis sativa TaxID=3483 RepID=A0A7J6FLK1_CANSA|nr:hypothetical protein G4B88_008220 [Cannabis sativa]
MAAAVASSSSIISLSLLRFTATKLSPSFSSSPLFLNSNSKRKSLVRLFSMAKESPANNPGLEATPDEATKGYIMQQTMFRIKDPKLSLDFYSRVLGMSLLKRLDFPEMKFSLYFLGYEATIELTHNWGTESDPEFKGYHNGNSDPRGFGHIGITVDDTYKACERFENLGVEFVKRPDDGKMKGIAFIKDPDGYWIEIFDLKTIGKVTENAAS